MDQKRSAARLAVVQALYQMEQTGNSVQSACEALDQGHMGLDEDANALPDPDSDLFSRIINYVVLEQAHIDETIATYLSKGWRMSRLDTISRAVLRAAIGELLACSKTDRAVILDEYVSLAGAFLDTAGTGFINGVLATASTQLRPDETTLEQPPNHPKTA